MILGSVASAVLDVQTPNSRYTQVRYGSVEHTEAAVSKYPTKEKNLYKHRILVMGPWAP